MRYYLPPSSPSSAIPDPPLPANGTLTPGYGSSGTPPHLYFLRLNQDLDIGYIKLFLNTRYVDLSHIEQKSPFEGAEGARLAALSRGVGGGEDRQSKVQEARRILKSSIWDEITYVIVQRKADCDDRERPGSGEDASIQQPATTGPERGSFWSRLVRSVLPKFVLSWFHMS